MRFCTSCGHELGIGRFCTNCGQPIDRSPQTSLPSSPPLAPTDGTDVESTAERRAARRTAALEPTAPRTPPSAADTPPAPRFPLFADEVRPGAWSPPTGGGTQTDLTRVESSLDTDDRGGSLLDRFGSAPADTPARGADGGVDGDGQQQSGHLGRGRRTWVVVALALVLMAVGLVVWLTVRGDPDTAADPAGGGPGAADAASGDLTADARATTPGNAPPATEIGGDKATFVAANLLDGDPATAWRVAGDASGKEVVLTLPEKTTITQVGLVNGYAKVAQESGGRTFDWYHGNRRITKVAWVFDDGTVVDQTLGRDRSMQSTDIDDVTTTTITLRILAVTAPGKGRASRDFTTISDVSLAGFTR